MAEKRRTPRSETKGRFRPLLVRMLAVWYDMSWKQLSSALGFGPSKLSKHLRQGEIKDDLFDKILEATRSRQVVILILEGCIRTLESLTRVPDLSEDELVTIERAAQGSARRTREGLAEIARLSRRIVPAGYPGALDLKPLRRRADELWARLKGRAAAFWPVVVEAGEEYQGWSFCEKVCELSVREASRDLGRAKALARLAVKVAERVQGPDWWQSRVRGYALAHLANILRVAGHFKAAEALLEKAKKLCGDGADPDGVLDPGRLLDIEGALRRDQRRFSDALACLEDAATMSRFPHRALLLIGTVHEQMGDYEKAVEAFLQAEPLIAREAEPRLMNVVLFDLAAAYVHLDRFTEAAPLVRQVQELAFRLGDDIDLGKLAWLRGRIAAGFGRLREAMGLLEEARRKFVAEGMLYDLALVLLEKAAVLLAQGQLSEARILAKELNETFKSKEIHREALAALRIFQEAAERETATAELARRVVRFLYRARYDQDLQFTTL